MYENTEFESELIKEAIKRAEERSSRRATLFQRLSELDTIISVPEPDTEEIRQNRMRLAKYAESVSQLAEEFSRSKDAEDETSEQLTEFGMPDSIPGILRVDRVWHWHDWGFPRPSYRSGQFVPRRRSAFTFLPGTGRYQLERSVPGGSRTTQAEGLVRGIGDADFGKIFITSQAANGQQASFSAEIGIVLQPESGRSRLEFWPSLSYVASGFAHVPLSTIPGNYTDLRAENTMSIWLIADSTNLQGQDQKQVASRWIDLWSKWGATGAQRNSMSVSDSRALSLVCNVAAGRIYYFWVIVETTTSTQVDWAKGNTSSCYVDFTLTVPVINVFQF